MLSKTRYGGWYNAFNPNLANITSSRPARASKRDMAAYNKPPLTFFWPSRAPGTHMTDTKIGKDKFPCIFKKQKTKTGLGI